MFTSIFASTILASVTISFADKAGVDILLVGDSAGMVVLGYENTLQVTMEQMETLQPCLQRK